uniref:Uncharacterized protein n=1 Tax=Phlegmariurus squarrosus TaxID=73615 RepID=H9M828_PHLSQ|nr:hypothetical protein HusqMp17 [Phlegmariurus squarrosus]AEV55735.1 hypothetical protein HusqMp17 [Phlegmariurus squarrosus]
MPVYQNFYLSSCPTYVYPFYCTYDPGNLLAYFEPYKALSFPYLKLPKAPSMPLDIISTCLFLKFQVIISNLLPNANLVTNKIDFYPSIKLPGYHIPMFFGKKNGIHREKTLGLTFYVYVCL